MIIDDDFKFPFKMVSLECGVDSDFQDSFRLALATSLMMGTSVRLMIGPATYEINPEKVVLHLLEHPDSPCRNATANMSGQAAIKPDMTPETIEEIRRRLELSLGRPATPSDCRLVADLYPEVPGSGSLPSPCMVSEVPEICPGCSGVINLFSKRTEGNYYKCHICRKIFLHAVPAKDESQCTT